MTPPAVGVGHPAGRRPDEMDHAGLHHGVRPGRFNGLFKAVEPIAADDEDVFDAAVGKFGAYRCPE